MTKIKNTSAAGFSLSEVLLAVVILSVGLLALAALQMGLIRSSSGAKMQSIAVSLGKQKIEQLRSFRQLTAAGATNPCNNTSSTSYIQLDGCTTTQTLGGTTYTVTTVVNRYVLASDTGTYLAVPNTTSESTLTADTTHTYVLGRDYKKVKVDVSWADATGAQSTLTLDDVVDGLNPADSAKVAKNSSSLTTRQVKVIISNPTNTAGVIAIPLATGSNEVDTAATNPKPVIDNNATETRFNIYTYAAIAGTTTALAQSQVETVMIGCTCDTAAAPTDSSTRGYRPTYWNGTRYVAPTLTTYTPPAGQSTSKKVDESPYCNICCRDHNDPAGTTTAKFSPWRATHTHYGVDSSGALVAVGTSGQTIYKEACRLIRTDGILRVAADYNDEYFGLLKTKNDGTTTEYSPDPTTATTDYPNFVLDYLGSKVVNNSNESTYNSPVAAATVVALETSRNINDPASITLQRSNDHKWLHARGLYIDYLEPEARKAIADAKANCVTTGCTSAQKQTAVLQVMPFTSINLTELANWSPLVSDNLYVSISNGAFTNSSAYNGSAPVRGYVVPATSGIPGGSQTQNGRATARNSNSGLQTLYDYAINNDDGTKSDTQAFAIPAGGNNNGGSFTVNFSNYGFPRNSAPALSGTNVTNCTSTKSGSSYSSACSMSVAGAMTLNATSYNAQSTNTSQVDDSNLTCTKSDGTSPVTLNDGGKSKVYVCSNYRVTSAKNLTTNVSGTVGAVTNDNRMAESTAVSFGSVSDKDVLELTYGSDTTTYGYTCTYTSSISDAQVVAAACK